MSVSARDDCEIKYVLVNDGGVRRRSRDEQTKPISHLLKIFPTFLPSIVCADNLNIVGFILIKTDSESISAVEWRHLSAMFLFLS